MPLTLAPYRQDRKTFPTPLVGDILFFELRDCTRTEFPAYGTPHPDRKKWPSHKLVFISEDGAGSDREGVFRFYYAAEREDQDLYNFEFTQADIGGTNFDAVARTYVTLRSQFAEDAVEMASTMPASVVGGFDNTEYILAERKVQRIGQQELDSLYVVEQRVYIKRVVLTQVDYDEQFGEPLVTTQRLYYKDEVVVGLNTENPRTAAELFADSSDAYWGLQANGYMREGKQLTANWYAITERQVVPQLIITGRTYYSTVDFSWPAVLGSIPVDTWERKDGGFEQYVRPQFSKEAYSGPCKATIVERFYLNPPSSLSVENLQPLPINLSNPLFGLSIGPTLHTSFSLNVSTGTNHPTYEYTAGSFLVPATTPTEWPSTLTVEDDVRPFRGGWLRQTITIRPPY